MGKFYRDTKGLTLPFALILTFIFSALVSVSYLFVSVNISQMQSNLLSLQAIAIAEGINERVKARLNTKVKIQLSPQQEEKLKSGYGKESEDEEDLEEGDTIEEDFDEETEDFDEYYADEILKISRYITFKDPPPTIETEVQLDGSTVAPLPGSGPESNVDMLGSIDIPRGTTLFNGVMIVVFYDEKFDLMLKDIVPGQQEEFKNKLPVPQIKTLTPNYGESGLKGSFVIDGKDLSFDKTGRFSSQEVIIEEVKGLLVEFLVTRDVMPGLTMFYWDTTPAEFYIIPSYDGSIKPTVTEARTDDGSPFLKIMAGQRHLDVKIYGVDLHLKKDPPVIVPDAVGIIPKVKEYSPDGKEIFISLDVEKFVDPGVHSLKVATEGGFSNPWLIDVEPADSKEESLSANTAVVSSSLTLLNYRVIEDLLPVINEKEDSNDDEDEESKSEKKDSDKSTEGEGDETEEEELSEPAKLGAFANADLETTWLLQTTAMVGKITKTVSEIVHREIPNTNSALITNGSVSFDGGGYQILGAATVMTILAEPTYISNTVLTVEGPKEEENPEAAETTRPEESSKRGGIAKSPSELGFTPGSLVAVLKPGERIDELDYSVIKNINGNNIELIPPGLMNFHYKDDEVTQFIPPVIAREKIETGEAEKHLIPKEFSITVPNSAKFKNIFKSNLEQFAELADYYTNDSKVPEDEFALPVGYMGLSYIEGTPVYDGSNVLSGKGILIIDTRPQNQGKPRGEVEITGDNKNPVTFSGVLYVHGNLKLEGNVSINGALIVDNESNGKVQIGSNTIGKLIWDPRAIKQTILYTPFTSKAGTITISNEPIDLSEYAKTLTGTASQDGLGTSTQASTESSKVTTDSGSTDTVPQSDTQTQSEITKEGNDTSQQERSPEEDLLDLF